MLHGLDLDIQQLQKRLKHLCLLLAGADHIDRVLKIKIALMFRGNAGNEYTWPGRCR